MIHYLNPTKYIFFADYFKITNYVHSIKQLCVFAIKFLGKNNEYKKAIFQCWLISAAVECIRYKILVTTFWIRTMSI